MNDGFQPPSPVNQQFTHLRGEENVRHGLLAKPEKRRDSHDTFCGQQIWGDDQFKEHLNTCQHCLAAAREAHK